MTATLTGGADGSRTAATPRAAAPARAGALVAFRATLRIARRTALRHRARSLLVLVMVLLPVYAGAVIAVSARTAAVPWQTKVRWELGRADVMLQVFDKRPDGSTGGEPDLPAAARVLRERHWMRTPVTTSSGTAQVASWAVDVTDPMLAGRYRVRSGTPPRTAEGVALSPRLAARLHARIGDTVRLGRPEQQRRVVGIVDTPGDLDAQFFVTAPDAPVRGRDGALGLWVDLPGRPHDRDLAPVMENCECSVTTWESFRPIQDTRDLQALGAVVVVVGFAVTEVVLLAGAAFAVGARRQTRELGLVGAAGGNASHVAQVVLGGGIVLGAVAGVLGAGLGVLTVALGRSVLEQWANHVVGGIVVRPAELAGIAAVAVLAGLAAAALPARGAARRSVLAALAGRRAEAGSSRRGVLAGLVTAGVGGLLTAVGAAPPTRVELVTAGSVVGLAGFALCAPALVGLAARTARLLPLAARMALRDAARHRNRAGAAVAAVTAAVAGSVALNLFMASQDDHERHLPTSLRIGQVGVFGDPQVLAKFTAANLAPVTDELPVRDAALLREAVVAQDVAVSGRPGAPAPGKQPGRVAPGATVSMPALVPMAGDSAHPAPSGTVGVGDARLLRLVTGREVPPEVARALDAGQAVVTQRGVRVEDGRVSLINVPPDGSEREPSIPAVTALAGPQYYNLPAVVVGERTAARLGLDAEPRMYLVDTTRQPTGAEEERARAALGDVLDGLGVDGPSAGLDVTRPHQNRQGAAMLVLVAISALVTLVATGISVGLTLAESRDDLSTLAAVGAAPRVRRVLSVAQAGVIAGLGTLLGVAGGVLPAAGVVGMRDELRWVVPWTHLGLLVVVVPLLAMLLTGLVTRSRLTLVRRPS